MSDHVDTRKMSVSFANGDRYCGLCVSFDGVEQRHGQGMYLYSDGTHDLYQQYSGQWRMDKKHGYGVLFYKNGGAYAGQWVNNKKNGLGLLLDNTGSREGMPSFRFEGQWKDDEPDGLGVEENDQSSYFGCFVKGKRHGRGVRMNISNGLDCEVLDEGVQIPLQVAMEAEAEKLRPSTSTSGVHELSSTTFHFANSPAADSRPTLASLFGPDLSSSSSGKGSNSATTQNSSPVVSPPPHSVSTPMLAAGSGTVGRTSLRNSQRVRASEGLPAKTQAPVVFSLFEENNLLSPKETTIQLEERDEPPQTNKRTIHLPPKMKSTGLFVKKETSTKKAPIRSPMLWSEDELAAFSACLGLSSTTSALILEKRLKGAMQMLEMSNSEMRREFLLESPVERLILRQSLKRLLDADRWENTVRDYKAGDLLHDPVLAKYSVPLSELEVVGQISQGGYGTVYRGVLDLKVPRRGLPAGKKHVAVKEMKGDRRVRLYELLKEACVMASLSHPNICTFIGVSSDTAMRKQFIISELMDGCLFDLIHMPHKVSWRGELTISAVVGLGEGICAGIAYLHSVKLVHADLKSSNILIDCSGYYQPRPLICDFGHAAVRAFPSPHHRCGTPHWAAPEVLRSEALGQAADVYSIGVVLWEMLTRKMPHRGLSFGQVLASVGWAGWSPDLSLLPVIPTQLRVLVRGCLKFIPHERPSSKTLHVRLRRLPRQECRRSLKMLASFFGWD